MNTLMASVASRPWVLQFFRNLFGSRHVTQEGQGSTADAKEKEDIKSELLDSPLFDTETILPGKEPVNSTSAEIHEELMESHTKVLSGMKESSLGDTVPIDEKKQPTLHNSTGLEMGDSEGFADSVISNLIQDPCEKAPVPGEKKGESSGDRETLGKDEIALVQCADNEEGASMISGCVEDCSAEEEREHLLKKDVRVKPPKADLSPWNRLINMYKQRQRLSSSKVSHIQDIPAQPQIEDEATLDMMMYGFPTLKSQDNSPKSSETSGVCGLPENEAEELAGHCEGAQGDLESKDAGILEHPKNVF